MAFLVAGLPLLLAIVVANVVTAQDRRRGRMAFNLALFAGSLMLLAGGIGLRWLSVNPADLPGAGLAMMDSDAAGLALIISGLWGALVSLSPVRQGLNRVFPSLEPDSAVHTLALAAIGYIVGNTLLTAGPGTLESLLESGIEPTIVDVLAQQFLFVLAAFLGVGLLVRRDSIAINERLGLLRPTPAQLWTGLRWMLFFVFLQGCVGAMWMLLNPAQAEALGDLNEALLGNFDTVWEWFLLAAAAGLGEELLFRGALQPIFGIIPTSLIFAVAHVQYGLSPATLTIFLLSVVLGIIRKRSNTTVAILVHAGYNFTLGMLSLVAVYLQSVVQ